MRVDYGSYFVTMHIEIEQHEENIIIERKRKRKKKKEKKSKATKLNRLYIS